MRQPCPAAHFTAHFIQNSLCFLEGTNQSVCSLFLTSLRRSAKQDNVTFFQSCRLPDAHWRIPAIYLPKSFRPRPLLPKSVLPRKKRAFIRLFGHSFAKDGLDDAQNPKTPLVLICHFPFCLMRREERRPAEQQRDQEPDSRRRSSFCLLWILMETAENCEAPVVLPPPPFFIDKRT